MATLQRYPVDKKISSKLLYLAQFSRYKHFCVLQFLQKIRKFKMATIFGKTNFVSKLLYLAQFSRFANFAKNQNGRHFWRGKSFWKIQIATLQRCPVGQRFRRNCSISHGFQDILVSIFVFCNFCEKFIMATILARQKFLAKCVS